MRQFAEKVYAAVEKIPRGRVMSYKDIARVIGRPRAARAVGNALNKNPGMPHVPCHRVVRSDGSIGGYAKGTRKKIAFLKREGVVIRGNRVEGFLSHPNYPTTRS